MSIWTQLQSWINAANSGTNLDNEFANLYAAANYLKDGSLMVGEIKAVDRSHPAISGLTLPDGIVEASGQLISDAASPFNTYRVKNLNGETLSIATTSRTDSTLPFAIKDTHALNFGDTLSGTGIPANSVIKAIDNATGIVTVGDSSLDFVSGTYQDITGITGTTASVTIVGLPRVMKGGLSTLSAYSQVNKSQAWQLGAKEDSTGARDYWGAVQLRDYRATAPEIQADQTYATYFITAQGSPNMLRAMNDGTNGAIRDGADNTENTSPVKFYIRIK